MTLVFAYCDTVTDVHQFCHNIRDNFHCSTSTSSCLGISYVRSQMRKGSPCFLLLLVVLLQWKTFSPLFFFYLTRQTWWQSTALGLGRDRVEPEMPTVGNTSRWRSSRSENPRPLHRRMQSGKLIESAQGHSAVILVHGSLQQKSCQIRNALQNSAWQPCRHRQLQSDLLFLREKDVDTQDKLLKFNAAQGTDRHASALHTFVSRVLQTILKCKPFVSVCHTPVA